MLLKTSPTPLALHNPARSGDKLGRAWQQAGFPGATRERPGLNVRELQVKYGPERAYAPQLREAVFTVPLGVQHSTYERERDAAIGRWFEVEHKKGYDPVLDSQHRVEVSPGIYPAPDLGTGTFDLGAREFRVRAWFRFRSPQPLRIELEPELLQPVRAAGA